MISPGGYHISSHVHRQEGLYFSSLRQINCITTRTRFPIPYPSQILTAEGNLVLKTGKWISRNVRKKRGGKMFSSDMQQVGQGNPKEEEEKFQVEQNVTIIVSSILWTKFGGLIFPRLLFSFETPTARIWTIFTYKVINPYFGPILLCKTSPSLCQSSVSAPTSTSIQNKITSDFLWLCLPNSP